MLILTRRIGEKIIIGDNIEVAILGIRGQQVRLGIVAPPDISVHRQEIHDRICRDEEDKRNAHVEEVTEQIFTNVLGIE